MTTAVAQLESVLAEHVVRNRQISSVISRPSLQESSFSVMEIDVRFADGMTLKLFAKATHWDALSPAARRAKPEFLWDQDRERTTYEAILSRLDVTSARYFGSYANASGVPYLLLERVPGVPLWQFGELEAWRETARWLARMHMCVGPHTATCSRAARHLLRYDRNFYNCWIPRALAFRHNARDELTMLMQRYPRVVERLLGEPASFIHGEFYAGNILVDRCGEGEAYIVRPVDWEMAALGPAQMDLACLLAGNWTDDERAEVADAYFRECAGAGGDIPPRAQYLETLDHCLIHLSVRNLGWSGTWTPPPDRDHDWIGEALRLCERRCL
jgi:hypothetical protein